jgi:hypothetical protein
MLKPNPFVGILYNEDLDGQVLANERFCSPNIAAHAAGYELGAKVAGLIPH